MEELFTVEFIGTFAGMVIAASLMTEGLKRLFTKLDPKIISFVVSAIVVFFVQIVVQKDFSSVEFGLSVANTFVVWTSTIAGYESFTKKVAKRTDKDIDVLE